MMRKLLSLFLIVTLLLSGCVVEIPLPAETPAATVANGETFTIHYIDVGQADCILLEADGEFMLIDGGNREDGQLVVSYLEQQGVQELEAVVCTHAHEDHVGGLPSVLAVYPTAAVYAPTKTYSSNIFDKFVHYTDQQGLEITIPEPGDSLTLGDVSLTVLGPVKSYPDPNNTSIVIMAEYGSTRFLFTGDMEKDAENDMLDHWGEKYDWNCDVLKSGHHGSSTSSSYRLIYETDPEYVVISVGADNSYGHPHKETIALYQDAGLPAFRTDELGHVIVTSDGTNVTVTWENQNAQPEDVEAADITYIGNKNSKKLHIGSCANLPKAENQVTFDTYEEAIAAGFTPCGSCMG